MRRTEYLINELRESTDNVDNNSIKDGEIISYLNYGQKLIQNIIFAANPKADIFKHSVSYTYDASGEYALPTLIFAENAISEVFYVQGEKELPMDRIGPSELTSGYYTEDKKLKVKGYKNFDIRVSGFKKLPRMDKRWGKIDSFTDGTSLTLATGYDENASTIDDYISVVDKFGVQVASEIFIDTFNLETWETTDSLAGVAIGNYVCMGQNSVNASLLPDDCETYLLDYARQRIYTRNNYDDAGKQVYFTDSQKADISSLFANNQRDNLAPPITDYEAMDF